MAFRDFLKNTVGRLTSEDQGRQDDQQARQRQQQAARQAKLEEKLKRDAKERADEQQKVLDAKTKAANDRLHRDGPVQRMMDRELRHPGPDMDERPPQVAEQMKYRPTGLQRGPSPGGGNYVSTLSNQPPQVERKYAREVTRAPEPVAQPDRRAAEPQPQRPHSMQPQHTQEKPGPQINFERQPGAAQRTTPQKAKPKRESLIDEINRKALQNAPAHEKELHRFMNQPQSGRTSHKNLEDLERELSMDDD